MRSPSILSKLSDLKATNPAAMSNLAFKCGGRSENQSGSENDDWRRFVSGMLKVQGFRDLCIKLEILDAIKQELYAGLVSLAGLNRCHGRLLVRGDEHFCSGLRGNNGHNRRCSCFGQLSNFWAAHPQKLDPGRNGFEGEAECGSRKDLKKGG